MDPIEVPEGYRLVRIGVRGRKPILDKIPLHEMTPQQRKDYKYRLKTREKRLEYQREYYKKNKEKISERQREYNSKMKDDPS